MTPKQQVVALKARVAKQDEEFIGMQRALDAARRDGHDLRQQLTAEQQDHAETKRMLSGRRK
jgi:hypothetical protein